MQFFSPREALLTIILFFAMLMAVIVSSRSHAAIPSSHFIFEKVCSQHGRGAYSIEAEVNFQEGIEKLSVRENWTVLDGGEMRVSVNSPAMKVHRILKKGRIYWIDQTGSERSDEVGSSYFMSPLITRSPTEEKKYFMRWKVLPSDALREKRSPKDLKDLSYLNESFVRLGRVSGVITYAYGNPTPVGARPLPGLWIEQDGFVIRKMRSPEGAEFYGNDYAPYSKNLWFPRNQVIYFDNHLVSIKILKVSAIETNNEVKRQFDVASLRGRSDLAAIWPKSPLAPVVQEFYKRFR